MKKKEMLIVLYRIIFMFISLIAISKITILGDYNRYSNSDVIEIFQKNLSDILFNRTFLTDIFVGGIRKILFGSEILTSIFFNLLSTYGIIYFLRAIDWNKCILIFLLLPSFNIWSSYPSKENIVIFSSGIVMGNLIQLFKNKKVKNKKIFFLSVYLLIVYKIQYMPSIIIFSLYLFFLIKKKKQIRILFYMIYLILSFLLLYLLREKIDMFLKNFHLNFFTIKETFRNQNIFQERYGFYKNMVYGMFISVWGPGIRELNMGNIKILSYLESMLIFLMVIYKMLMIKVNKEKIFVLFNCLFWLFLAQYPFGVFNAGAAVRYRTNLYIIFLTFFYIFILKDSQKELIKLHLVK